MNPANTSNIEKSKGKKSVVELNNLENDDILKKIFDNMKKNKSLEVLKYNKKLQKRLNLSIDDYKEYLSIEIELKTVDEIYDKFINIPEGEKEYYHIYFDNSEEEIKRNYLNKNEEVKVIKILIDYQVKSFNKLFDSCKCISSITFKRFDRNNITDMSYMFDGCSSLKELNLSNFNTINVTDMKFMFFKCSSLKVLNLSKFNTHNVNNMSSMFAGCSSLIVLKISNFNTNKVP